MIQSWNVTNSITDVTLKQNTLDLLSGLEGFFYQLHNEVSLLHQLSVVNGLRFNVSYINYTAN